MENLLSSLHDFVKEYETKVAVLEKQNDYLSVEVQYLKQCLVEKTKEQTPTLYLLGYFRDNGEGYDTYTCCGVFSVKSIALENQQRVMKHGIHSSNLFIDEYKIEKEIPEYVNVYHEDHEEHCETYTHILGVENQYQDGKCGNVYTINFKLNEFVWDIE